ncbi:MAG: 50S ribosomal protein L5 [Patescibacteria group bacterium]
MTINAEEYRKSITEQITKVFASKNALSNPGLDKITINVGCGAGSQKRYETKDREAIAKYLEKITGQKAAMVASRKSIAGFKLRAGEVVGVRVTLRGVKMYDFLLKLIYVALPRTRDFRGISNVQVDKQGNYSLGIKSSSIFPEVGFDAEVAFGMQVNFVIKNIDPSQTSEFLKILKLPINE